jgi:enoyl-CoA hydratase/carnithine racemase
VVARLLTAVATSHDGMACHVTVPGGQWGEAVATELVDVAGELVDDRQIRVITLGARLPSFCTGIEPGFDPLRVDPDPASAWARLRPPVVAVIEGQCLSVGLEVALAADIRVCGPDATFALPDIGLGRLPCWGGTQRLGRAVRPAEATAMLLLGTALDGPRACQLGLVHQVSEHPAATAGALVGELVARGPLALELAKEAVHRGAELPLRDGLRLEGDLNHQLAASEDRAAGLAAFFDRRPPDFSGR